MGIEMEIKNKKKIIIGNWKLNPKTENDAIQLTNDIMELILVRNVFFDLDVCIIPPQLFIPSISGILRSTSINIGAQNCHYESEGSFTGEVSVESLKDYDVKYILCGHSERRMLFHENNIIINKKIKKIVNVGLTAILCIGELLEEKELELVKEVCATQIKFGLNGIKNKDMDKIIIAYEPVWAIGTGKVCEAEDAEKVIKYIRELIANIYGDEIGQEICIIYGGSVNSNNIKNIMSKDIDGCLVGGASINAESFVKILLEAN